MKYLIKAIDNKRVSLSQDEYKYFLELKNKFGDDEFRGLFNSDNNGNITSITPPLERPSSFVIIYFLLNVMLNQRLRMIDSIASKFNTFEERLLKIENKL